METLLTPNGKFSLLNNSHAGTDQMTFMNHLEALRWHLVRAAAVLLSASIAMFVFVDWLFDNVVFAPARAKFITYTAMCDLGHTLHLGDALCMPPINIQLMGNTVSGPFMSAISIAFTFGLIISFPYILWELWRFVKPALSTKEIKMVQRSIGWVALCFFLGAAFGYFLLAPFTFNFLANFKLGNSAVYVYIPTLDDYIDTLTSLIIGCGIAFELPVVAFLLAKLGFITATLLKKYRKYAYVIILIVAAVITPSPDWTSQTIVTIPLLLLFEVSIMLTKRVEKNKLAQD